MKDLELLPRRGQQPATKETTEVVDGVLALERLLQLVGRPDVESVQLLDKRCDRGRVFARALTLVRGQNYAKIALPSLTLAGQNVL